MQQIKFLSLIQINSKKHKDQSSTGEYKLKKGHTYNRKLREKNEEILT